MEVSCACKWENGHVVNLCGAHAQVFRDHFPQPPEKLASVPIDDAIRRIIREELERMQKIVERTQIRDLL